MSETPLRPGGMYMVKHGARTTRAKISEINSKVNIETLDDIDLEPGEPVSFGLNDIGTISLLTAEPLCYDRYQRNRYTGGFIIIDPATNATVAAGMLKEPVKAAPLPEFEGYMI